MATLEASTSHDQPKSSFTKKGKGPTPNKSATGLPPNTNVARKYNRPTRRGGNVSTVPEQNQELAVISNHTISFVVEATTSKPKPPTASSSRPKATPNRRGNKGPINMDGQQTLTGLSNHTITFAETNSVSTTSQQPEELAPAAETSTGGKGKGKGPGKTKKIYPARPRLDPDEHLALVVEAARTVTEIFRKSSISCAVFGSLASKLYGCARAPKDVDMLVSQTPADSHNSQSAPDQHTLDAEGLKDLILRANSHNFYLKMPRNPEAKYRILWYRQSSQGPECKVDILVPGIMHLPYLRPERVVWKDNVPLVPFSLLLLQKLQGWDDHCNAEEAHYRRKHPQDAADVRRLLGRTEQMDVLRHSFCLEDEELFTREFQELTIERVKRYCEVFQDRAERWKMIGFSTPS